MASRASDQKMRQQFTDLKKIGKGSFGSVYRGTRRDDGRVYAIKKVSMKDMPKKEQAEALNEIRLLASLTHAHIIRYCDAWCEGSSLYIVTEFAKRGDLGAKIKRNHQRRERLPEKDIWLYFAQICASLEYMHSREILHRDLKPMNVLMYNSKHVCLADLGCSKLLKARLPHTQVGTPYYMAPEIWKHQRYDTKCDVWSLGILLYEMCELKPPFSAQDLSGLANKVKYSEPPRISSSFSKDMSDMIKRLLQKDPSSRPSIPEIMRMSIVKKYSKHVEDILNSSITSCVDDEVKMLPTIQVPYNIKQVKLPPSRYPTADPSRRPSSAKGRIESTAQPPSKPSSQYESKAHPVKQSKYANMAVHLNEKENHGGNYHNKAYANNPYGPTGNKHRGQSDAQAAYANNRGRPRNVHPSGRGGHRRGHR